MAEPLSIASSVAGLIALADLTYKRVYKYVRAVKDGKSSIQDLADEVHSLAGLLRTLEALASELEAEDGDFDPALRIHHLGHCKKTFGTIEKRVKKAADSFTLSKREGIVRQLKWPFSTSETNDLLSELSRHKETITADALGQKIAQVEDVVRRIEINTLIAVDDKKMVILEFFMEFSPQPGLEMSIRLRHAMTGLWLTESPTFATWLENPGSKLWLTGIPGAGKTVLAGSVIQEALTRSHSTPGGAVGAAFFFCDYKVPVTWDPVNILGALASQLARQKDEAFEILRRYHAELHPPGGLPKSPDPEELRAKVSQMSELFDQTFIVVDGLDECDDSTDDVVEFLLELAQYSDTISMALFSRNHIDIRIRLEEDFEIIHIAAHTDDISLYVSAELERRIQTHRLQISDPSIKDEIRDILVNRAQGMFRWVVCQLDHICDCAHDDERREALQKLPPDLPDSYRRLLERVNRCSPKVKAMVRMCLQFIGLHHVLRGVPNLTISQLRQAVSTPSTPGESLGKGNMISEQEIARRCSSLIRKSKDGMYFEYAHFSVLEFLRDEGALSQTPDRPDLKEYCLSTRHMSALLAVQCLRFLQLPSFDRQPEADLQLERAVMSKRNEKYDFYPYAAKRWIRLAREAADDAAVTRLTRSLFDLAKTSHFSSWAVELFRHLVEDLYCFKDTAHNEKVLQKLLHKVLDCSFRPLHMAAALNIPEICEYFLEQGGPVNLRCGTARPIDFALASIAGIPELGIKFHEGFYVGKINGFEEYVSQSRQRNSTIACFLDRGGKPSEQPLSLGATSIFSITCSLAPHYLDVTPIVALLSAGITPQDVDIDIFEASFNWFNYREPLCNIAETSTLDLLRYLKSSPAGDTEWGLRIRERVWKWAFYYNVSYANDPVRIDSKMSMSKEALVTKILGAVADDDAETINLCLADGRLDLNGRYGPRGGTLLHCASEDGLEEALGALLAAGCDASIPNQYGSLPIHACRVTWNIHVIPLFMDVGVSPLSPNSKGENIWHGWAQVPSVESEDSLGLLFEVVPEATFFKALLMKSHKGDTPLTTLLKVPKKEFDVENPDDIVLLLMRTCSDFPNFPNFWQIHKPIYGEAAAWGSDAVISYLVSVGARSEPVIHGVPTPLHQIHPRLSMNGVQPLLDRYKESLGCRFEGHLPVELYIIAALRRGSSPSTDIVEALRPPNYVTEENRESDSPWKFICGVWQHLKPMPSRDGSADDSDDSDGAPDSGHKNCQCDMIGGIILVYLRFGALRSYEERTGQSGLILLLGENTDAILSGKISIITLRETITQTGLWARFKESGTAISFVKNALDAMRLDIVQLFLEAGLDIHTHIDGDSIIEHAIDPRASLRICEMEYGANFLKWLLDRSTAAKLRETSPKSGLSLLHRLATDKKATNILWLAKALVERGVDINGVGGPSALHATVLVYHLGKSSMEYAELLLDLGADPTSSGKVNRLDAVLETIRVKNLAFLKRILVHTSAKSIIIEWAKTCSIRARVRGETVTFEDLNALHVASFGDSRECLEFLLDQRLLSITQPPSAEGYTPLHLAAFMDSPEVIRLLIARGSNVMTECKKGMTPLHMAAKAGSFASAKLLLDNGALSILDSHGESPRDYAAAIGRTQIMEILDGPTISGSRVLNMSSLPVPELRLIQKLEIAIRKDDKNACRRLLDDGCPVNTPLHSSRRDSPLLLSLKLGRLDVTECLLDNGANTLKSSLNGKCTAIEFMAQTQTFHTLFTKFLDIYCAQGGNLVSGSDYPLHVAVARDNTDGLESLLLGIKINLDAIGKHFLLSHREVISVLLDRRIPEESISAILDHRFAEESNGDIPDELHSNLYDTTPLHLAASHGSLRAAALLIDNGASVDSTDSNGLTPLLYAKNSSMFEYLITRGASISAICRLGSVDALRRWSRDRKISLSRLWDDSPENPLQPPGTPGSVWSTVRATLLTQSPLLCHNKVLSPDEANGVLAHRGCDLTTENAAGQSLMHCLLSDGKLCDLVIRDHGGKLSRTTPFPWHLEWYHFSDIPILSTKFRKLGRVLPRHAFQRIANLEPFRAWSPLCRAALFDLPDVIENCLALGAQIDFEGCPLGSALMVASACGSLGAVKCLVRNHASLAYTGVEGVKSCVSMAASEAIRSWLLVGRFTTAFLIGAPGEDDGAQLRPWAGVAQARLHLTGKLERRPSESSLDYARRLGFIMKEMHGTIVPTFGGLVYPPSPPLFDSK